MRNDGSLHFLIIPVGRIFAVSVALIILLIHHFDRDAVLPQGALEMLFGDYELPQVDIRIGIQYGQPVLVGQVELIDVVGLLVDVHQVEMWLPLELAHLFVLVDRVAAHANVNKNVLVIVDDLAACINRVLQVDCGVHAPINEIVITEVLYRCRADCKRNRGVNALDLHLGR